MKRVVTHLITGLGKGGAETMLYQILKYRSDKSIEHRVISMGGGSYYQEKIEELGIGVKIISYKRHPLSSFFRIAGLLKDTDILCCWMYHANFVGYVSGKIVRVKKIIWNIRHSDLSPELNRGLTLRINKWCAKRSNKVSSIIYNGDKAKAVHEAVGYSKAKSVVLDNGVDSDIYKPDQNAKSELCKDLGIGRDKQIVLSVTRYHPIKDIPTFIKAFGVVHTQLPDAVAVMCGNGIDTANEHIIQLCARSDIEIGKNIYLLGLRDDVPRLMAACDLFVLHSAGEAFPNTLVQAMACGCLCVATDVGDVRRILDNEEHIVRVGDGNSLADNIIHLLSKPQTLILTESLRERKRVVSEYGICSIIQKYELLF